MKALEFATVQGKPIPVRIVPMEGWRRKAEDDTVYKTGMDVYRGRWETKRINVYLSEVKDKNHPYWQKFTCA